MKTPYELESLGWKITQISSSFEYCFTFSKKYPCDGNNENAKGCGYCKCWEKFEDNIHDYNIYHAFHFPYSHEMNDTTLLTVLEFINNFIKEEQHKEGIERFNLDR